MSFKVGDKVICIVDENWRIVDTKEITTGPKKDDELIVAVVKTVEPYLALGFVEWPANDLFDARYFRKLSDIQALHDYKLNTTILEDLSAPIKIGKGLPQREELEKLEKI